MPTVRPLRTIPVALAIAALVGIPDTSVALDTGDPRVGAKLDDVPSVPCPEGHGEMLQTMDSEQVHIWYETCETCNGIYLDAGEFTDLKFRTLMDRVRDLVKGPRPDQP